MSLPSKPLTLTPDEAAMRRGDAGPGAALAMDILATYSDALGAERLIPVTRSHIDGCLYHGQASLDFIDRLVDLGARVRVPTTLNIGAMDLIHPELVRLPAKEAHDGRRLMTQHEALGCISSFTCAPYQTLFRPQFGEQIAWGESNAIVFANSVIGARTNRYGDFIDLCCAITGRAPAWGLHLDENRRGEIVFEIDDMPRSDTLYVGVGLVVGKHAGDRIPVLVGLPPPETEDSLKALGAASASSGSVALFHAVGITPEAPTLKDALGGRTPIATHRITKADIASALARFSMADDGTPISAVCLGTPHFSLAEWQRLDRVVAQQRPSGRVPIYVNTGRATLEAITTSGLLARLEPFGVRAVADTCTYIVPILENLSGVVMTNSGKWAYYGPGNLGVRAVLADLEDCIASAVSGVVTRGGR
ncbi:MAG: hypothetical protein RL291_1376 [Pseudomonadota bacterium]